MIIRYKRPFAQFVKKSRKPLQLAIEDIVLEICRNPRMGIQKKGDLQGVYVYKFRFHRQEYLMAYRYGSNDEDLNILWIDFYRVGSHENFYAELKKLIH